MTVALAGGAGEGGSLAGGGDGGRARQSGGRGRPDGGGEGGRVDVAAGCLSPGGGGKVLCRDEIDTQPRYLFEWFLSPSEIKDHVTVTVLGSQTLGRSDGRVAIPLTTKELVDRL
jgi:hypothetical protein